MAARVPAADALIVGLARYLGRTFSGGQSAWTIEAEGFATDDFLSIAEDVINGYLTHPEVRGQVTTFATELHAAGLDAETRPSGGAA